MALHGLSFLFDVDVMDTKQVNSMMCSSNCNSRRVQVQHLSLFCSKSALARGRFGPRPVHLVLRKARLSPFRPVSRWSLGRPCQAKGEDTEEVASSETILLDEQTLKQDLQSAIQEENYTRAAKIRDTLQALHDNSKSSVEAANTQFYDSFRNGNLAAMQELWSKSENACCVHPGAKAINGYEIIMESWDVVMMNYEFPLDIKLRDVHVHLRGDVGYVTCVEFIKTNGSSWGAQTVTNVFEKVDGKWFICIHHASPIEL